MKKRRIFAAILSASVAGASFLGTIITSADAVADDAAPVKTALTTADPSGYVPSETTAVTDQLKITFVDGNGEIVEGVKARIERRKYIRHYDGLPFYDQYTDAEVVAEIENSSAALDEGVCGFGDVIVVDKLPEGYMWRHATFVEMPISRTIGEVRVELDKEDNIYNSYPKKGNFKLDIRICDPYTLEYIKGLECVLFDADTGEEYASWTTAAENKKIENVPYYLGDKPGTDSKLAVRVKNLPEGMSFAYDCTPLLRSNEILIDPMFRAQSEHNPTYAPYTLNILGGAQPSETKPVVTGTKTSPLNVMATTTTVSSVVFEPHYISGDVNCDWKISIADAAAILQYLGNRDKYPLGEVALANADCDGEEGITIMDAVAIQKLFL